MMQSGDVAHCRSERNGDVSPLVEKVVASWANFRLADDTPGTMLADATGNYRLAPTSKNYTLNRPPRAGVCSPFRIAHIENKGRLPRGVTQDFAKQARPQRRFSQRLFMVDHFH